MKTKASRLIAMLLGLIAWILSADAAEVIRLRADYWMPYNGTPQDEYPGFVVDLAKAIFEPQGYTIDYGIMPWTDALAAARAAKIDGVIGAAAPLETEGLIAPEEPMGEPRIVVVVARGNSWAYDINALGSIRLGVIEGYSYWDKLDEYITANKEPQVVRFSGTTPLVEALKQFKEGKIDVLPENLAVFRWAAKENGLTTKDFRIAHVHKNDPLYLAFSKTEAGRKYATLFDQGIRKLRASGELEKLLARYDMTDWK